MEVNRMKRRNWKDDLPFRVVLPNGRTKFSIEYQEWVLQQVTGEKVVYSKGPFRIRLANGKVLAAGLDVNEPIVQVIVWKDQYGSGIRNDGTETYKLPLSKAKSLPKVYYDVTNQSYAVDDRRVYA